MLRWLAVVLLLGACGAAHAQASDCAAIDPLVETRAMWVDAGAIPRTVEGVSQLVRSYHKANINLLFPEVIARGYTVYPSKLLARDPRFAGAPDVLDAMIKQAHALGIEVHPWVWVFRAGYTKDKGAILSAHPDWAELGKDGKELSAGGGYWISPAVPAARDFLASLYAELVSNYDVDGIHLDYIRYETEQNGPFGYSEFSRAAFADRYGIDPLEIDRLSVHMYEWMKFRERQVNTFMQRIALQTRSLKPNAKVSAAVGADPKTARLGLSQNWVNWVDNKWVDFVVPMSYSSDADYFRNLVTRETEALQCRTVLVSGLGLYAMKDRSQVVDQIGVARELGAFGQAIFASSYFGDADSAMLTREAYRRPAAQPFRAPQDGIRLLTDRAETLCKQGAQAQAAFYTRRAAGLSSYSAYQQAKTGYVLPSPPPISIPNYVAPLPSLDIPRVSEPMRIDGVLDDGGWRQAASAYLLYTNLGAEAPVPTVARLAWDSANLYIAFECAEPSVAKLKANATMLDEPTFNDDSVELFVASGSDANDYFHISTNTIETRFDQRADGKAWNGEWKTATKVGPSGWVTEIALPFASLGVAAPSPGAQWRLNLARNRTTSGTDEHLTWAVPYGSFHTPERFGSVTFR